MKKKWLAALAAIAVAGTCAAALAACKKDNGGHEHDFDTTKWVSSNEYHSHPCKVEGCTAVSGSEKHVKVTTVTATCTADGETVTTCSVEGCPYEVRENTSALGHEWGAWTVAESDKPTATAAGTAKRTCTREGCTAEAQTAELPALTSTDYTVTNNTAKCLEAGTGEYSVVKEGATVTFGAETAALGHDFASTYTVTETEHYYPCKREGCAEKSMHGDHIWQLSAEGVSADSVKYVCYNCRKTETRQVTFTGLQNGSNAVSVVRGNETVLAYRKITAAVAGLYYLKADDSAAYVSILQGNEVSTHGGSSVKNIYLEAGETVYLVYDVQSGASLDYNVTYYAPGTQTNPVRVNNGTGGTSADITLAAGEKLYYFLVGGNALYASFTEANASMVVTTADGTETYTGANGDNIVLDANELGGDKGNREETDENAGIPFYFTSEQNVTFTVTFEEKIDKGAYANPYGLLLDTDTPVSVKVVTTTLGGRPSRHGEELWFAFTPAVTGWYRFYSTDENAAFISATYDRYGDDGNGFDFTVYIDKSKYEYVDAEDGNAVKYRPYMCQLTSADGNGALEAEYSFKVVKAADPVSVTLGEPVTATADSLFFEFVTTEEAEYVFEVSELSTGNYFTVEYPDMGTVKSITATEKSVKATIGENETVYIRLNEACTLTIKKSENDPYALSLGKSVELTVSAFNSTAGQVIYTFTVPADGNYSFALSSLPRNSQWTVNGTIRQTAAVTLENLTAGNKVTMQVYDTGRTVTILPTDAETLPLVATTPNTLSIDSGITKLIYIAGTSNSVYRLTPLLNDVAYNDIVFVDENGNTVSGNEFTADVNGNILVRLKYVGAETNSGEFVFDLKQVITLGTSPLSARVYTIFTAEQDGNYVMSGITVNKKSGWFEVNGTRVIENTSNDKLTDQTYTVNNVKAGDEIIIYAPLAQATFKIELSTVTSEA